MSMKIKRILRLIAFALMIGLACILPGPKTFSRKDDVPKYLIEQMDTKDDKEEDDDLKELF